MNDLGVKDYKILQICKGILDREQFFINVLNVFEKCKFFEEIVINCLLLLSLMLKDDIIILMYQLLIMSIGLQVDEDVFQICLIDIFQDCILYLVKVGVDGNCLLYIGSIIVFGNEDRVVEIRVKIIVEVVFYMDFYFFYEYFGRGIELINKDLVKICVFYFDEYVVDIMLI